jgi:hypothetical protein
MPQWIPTVDLADIDDEDVVRFDNGSQTFAIYRVDDTAYASDGLCTHEKVHLCDGLVMDHVIECPKHRSGPANLSSAISGNSGHKAGPLKAWREGVFDGQEISAPYAAYPQPGVQGAGGPGSRA